MKHLRESAFVKVILYLSEKDSARFSEFLNDITISKSTLIYILKKMQDEQLVERKVMDTRPVQTRYALTTLGKEIAQRITALMKLISDEQVENSSKIRALEAST